MTGPLGARKCHFLDFTRNIFFRRKVQWLSLIPFSSVIGKVQYVQKKRSNSDVIKEVTSKGPNVYPSVVQKVDYANHWINFYPVVKVIDFPNTYPLDSDLSGGEYYPAFEQLGPDGQTLLQRHRYQRPCGCVCTEYQNCKRAQSLFCHPTTHFSQSIDRIITDEESTYTKTPI